MKNSPPCLKPLQIDDDLKALTIRRPWAWAILEGWKRVENRSWTTNFRGTLAIHAGRSPESDEQAIRSFQKLGLEYPKNFVAGKIIGTVRLVEILPLDDYLKKYGNDPMNREFALGPYCWVLTDPKKCIPLACRGNFQLWNVQKILSR